MKSYAILALIFIANYCTAENIPDNLRLSRVVLPIDGTDDMLFRFEGKLKYECLNGGDYKVHYLTVNNGGKDIVLAIFNGLHPNIFSECTTVGRVALKICNQDIELEIKTEASGKKFALGYIKFGNQLGVDDKTGEWVPTNRVNVLQLIFNIKDEAELSGIGNNIKLSTYKPIVNSNQSLKGRM